MVEIPEEHRGRGSEGVEASLTAHGVSQTWPSTQIEQLHLAGHMAFRASLPGSEGSVP